MKLYTGNLSRDVTDQDLRAAFEVYGKVESAIIIKDGVVSKGFGFVEMENAEEAKAAMAGLHGKEFKGRSMDVNEARPRPERRSGGGGNRGGGGRRFR